jgi:hypothetical protein
MKKLLLCLIILFCSANLIKAQTGVSINTDGTDPDVSSILDIKSTGKGLLIPRMDLAARNLIGTPATGLLIFQTDAAPGFYFYNGTSWEKIADGNVLSASLDNGKIFVGNVSNTATGVDLSGDATINNAGVITISNDAITNSKILNDAVGNTKIQDGAVTTSKIANNSVDGSKINLTGNANGDLMYYNGTDWVRLATGSNGEVLKVVGGIPAWGVDANNTYTGSTSVTLNAGSFERAALTGDVTAPANSNTTTIANNAVTTVKINNDAVDNTKLSNMATQTIKGRNTAGTGDPEDLTPSQVRTMINVADGANNYVHPNHTGDVTSTGDGATTIANNAVTTTKINNDAVDNTKLSNMATQTIKGRNTAGTGDPEDLTATEVRTILNVADGANNYVHPTQSAIDVDATNNGINVIDRVQVNTLGHVTSVTTRDLSNATTTNAGVMSAADKTKLDGIASGATANTGTVTSVATNNGITGGTITTTGTIGLTGNALSLHNLATNGLVTRTAANTLTSRSVATSGNGISISNGDGVAGNPTLSLNIGTGATQVAAGDHTHAILTRGAGLTGNNYNGSSATSWAVDFGNATLAGNGLKAQGNFGQFQPHTTYTNFNTNPTYWGWNYVQGTTNAPNATSSQWYRQVVSLGSDYPARGAGGYSLELAFPRYSHSAAGVWMRTVEDGTIGGWTRLDAGGIGSGTTNYVTKWTSATTIGNSQIFDNGTNVGVGTNNPQSKLHVTDRVELSRMGLVGTYNSAEVQQIWSIGRAYNINTTDNDFGNSYGIAYAHTNAGTATNKKPIANWGHQILFTHDGVRNASISLTNGNAFFAGNVGINNIAPETRLQVNSTSSGGLTGASAYGGLHLKQDAANDGFTGITASATSNGTQGGILFQGSGAYGTKIHFLTTNSYAAGMQNRMTLDHIGNLGIGTTAPLERLHVNGNLRVETGIINSGIDHLELMRGVRADDNSYEWVGFYSGNTRQGIILYDGAWTGANNLTNEFSITAENSNMLTLNSGTNQHIALMPKGTGNVGVGTLSPTVAKLQVAGHIYPEGYYIVQNGIDGGNTRGIRMWTATDPNWGIYMGQSGANRSMSNGTAVAGAGFSAHAIRFRTANSAAQGFIWENASEQLNMSLRASDGLMYVRGNVGIGNTAPEQSIHTAGQIMMQNTSPTVYFRDTDHRSGMIHMNSNLMYFLSANGNNSGTWAINGSYWPLTINMTNDEFTFGGAANFMEGNVRVSALSGTGNRVVRADAIGTLNTNNPVCPVFGYAEQQATVNLTHYTICIYAEAFNSNWNQKSNDCINFYQGAKICTIQQVRMACATGNIAVLANRWLGDSVSDDNYFRTNGTDCNNFDGTAGRGTSYGVYCCLEFPK